MSSEITKKSPAKPKAPPLNFVNPITWEKITRQDDLKAFVRMYVRPDKRKGILDKSGKKPCPIKLAGLFRTQPTVEPRVNGVYWWEDDVAGDVIFIRVTSRIRSEGRTIVTAHRINSTIKRYTNKEGNVYKMEFHYLATRFGGNEYHDKYMVNGSDLVCVNTGAVYQSVCGRECVVQWV